MQEWKENMMKRTSGKKIDYPAPMSTSRTFKKAPKAKGKGQEQKELF